MKNLFAIAFTTLLLAGCSADDPLIDSFDDGWRYLVSGPNGVATVRMPEGTIQDPSVWTSSDPAPYPIHTIKAFRDEIFLLGTDYIVVLEQDGLTAIDTIDVSGKGLVKDIAFANATTAYATFPATNEVGIIDLTTKMLARTIPVLGSPHGIAVLGNQMCVALQDIDEAAIIDTRTNDVEQSIEIPTAAPTYVAADPINLAFGVVALGEGKLPGDDRARTTPRLTFINLDGFQVNPPIDLTFRADQGPDQIPGGIVANANQFMFVGVQSSLLFVSTRSQNRASSIQFDSYSWVGFHGARNQVLALRSPGNTLDVFDELGETRLYSVILSDSISSAIGIAP